MADLAGILGRLPGSLSELKPLSLSEPNKEKIVSLGGLPKLLAALDSNSPASVEICSEIIRYIASGPDDAVDARCDIMVALNFINPLLKVCQTGTEAARVHCATSLRSLTCGSGPKCEERRNAFINCGSIPGIVGVLPKVSMATQEHLACVLRNLTVNNDENRKSVLFQFGAIGVLLPILEKGNEPCREHCSAALQNLSMGNEVRRVALSDQGVYSVMCKVLMSSTSDLVLQHCTATLRELSIGADGERRRDLVVKAGLVPVVKNILANVTAPKVKEHASCILRNVTVGADANCESRRETIVTSGCLSVIANVVLRESLDNCMEHLVCTLRNVAVGNGADCERRRNAIIDTEGVILALLKELGYGAPNSKEHAAACIRSLTAGESATRKVKLFKAQALNTLIKSLTDPSLPVAGIEHSCAAIRNLVLDSADCGATAIQLNGVQILTDTLVVSPDVTIDHCAAALTQMHALAPAINKPNINVHAKNGLTGLYVACEHAQGPAVGFLLRANADANLANKNGDYPVHAAAKSGSMSIAKALVDAGGNSSVKDSTGRTAEQLARERGYADLAEYFKKAAATAGPLVKQLSQTTISQPAVTTPKPHQNTAMPIAATSKVDSGTHQIFISLRFGEAMEEAKLLKIALEGRGYSTFLCDIPEGDDIASAVISAIDGCKLAVIMGTTTYGKNTKVGFSTFDELRFICDESKPMFLIKMCDRFEIAETRFRIGKSVSYFDWQPRTPMPDRLVDRIVEKFQTID